MKYPGKGPGLSGGQSPPARGAWIEMATASKAALPLRVAPREGGVD